MDMDDMIKILKKNRLFKGLEDQEIEEALTQLAVSKRIYAKDETIYSVGDSIDKLGIVIQGGVYILREDIWGNRNIIAKADSGELFAETYACLKAGEMEVHVTAAADTVILFLTIQNILDMDRNGGIIRTIFIRNLLYVLAEKNLMLNRKLQHVMQRTTREKILSYLSEQSLRAHSCEFTIPFNRQQLADYLSVDRSAMSGELGKLQKEGMIKFEKNRFKVIF